MNTQSGSCGVDLREVDNLSAVSNGTNFGHSIVTSHGEIEAKHRAILVKWLNSLFPSLNLPKNIRDDELRECLSDGTVLCQILNKLSPGSVNVVSDGDQSSQSNSENIKRFLAAIDSLGLPQFGATELEKGSLNHVVDCLIKLRSLHSSSGDDNISVLSFKSEGSRGHASRSSPTSGEENKRFSSESKSKLQRVLRSAGHKFHEMFQLKNGSLVDMPSSKVSEIMKSNSIENASTQYILTFMNGILDESAERRNGEIPYRVVPLLKKIVQEIERRISIQAEHLRTQNNILKVRDEKYQSRIRVLEALASGTREESEMVASQLKQLMTEKTKVEEEKKASEEELIRLKEEMDHITTKFSTLKQELETTKDTCLQLEAEAEGAKGELNQKSKEYELQLNDLLNKVKELETSSDSKYHKWNMEKNLLQEAVDFQFSSLQKIKLSWQSIVQDILKEQKMYMEESNQLGVNLKPLVDAANNYHVVLAENRRLFNEVQELKGNIRVYCRIRPFIPGQREKRSIIQHTSEKDLVVANRSKQGKEALRSFSFNKIFGPTTSQEDVYSDIQPFIRSVLDGYNACIFAYGQTGSGKTYTMSGPNGATEETYGVNYRALNDLFSISSSRTGSIVYEVWVQMVEIYNEQVRDLLATDASKKRLGILTQPQPKGLAVPDASMFRVNSTSDVLMLMDIGLKNRAMGATAMNERSSRSHSVVSIHVRGKDIHSGSSLHGNLHLVDLAGSERVDRSEATGDRLKEAQHINKSLSALGDVIFALAQKSSHVPYRNSKLTQLLQSSLGGHAKTLMFVQLNPDVNSFSESLSTLKFAERVSGVELGQARSTGDGKDVRELMEQIAFLKNTIALKDEEIEQLQSLRDVRNVCSERAFLRYGSPFKGRESISRSPKRDHTASGGRNTQLEAHFQQSMDGLRQDTEFFQFPRVAGNSPDRPEIFRYASEDYGGRLSDFSDGGFVGTEADDLFDNKVHTENRKSPLRMVKSKPSPKTGGVHTAHKSPLRAKIFRHGSADYGATPGDHFSERGFRRTVTDDQFDNQVVAENKKSPFRTMKSKVASKVTRVLPKTTQPSPTTTKGTAKKSPRIKRSNSGGLPKGTMGRLGGR
ncbi:kinesin-like protein KIN-14C isoform X2 [Prosopis cineraria]|uniref:kinesin-like protein KIN-14C isoform X2 n=1 Tax=Prosopis cineraria TaxID=364024 RepID=UPI00240EE960|nr:kinesin-like protein KIN-14C isoform X2 [Prosopis cineraria]